MAEVSTVCGDALMIVFISCTKKKASAPCTAKEMYSPSQWFKAAWAYAESLNPDAIYILSAKYGLLKPDDRIAPYEKTLVAEKDAEIRKWSIMVYSQIQQQHIDRTQKAVFLCGKNYRKYIKNLFPNQSAPCQHLGIGEQLKYFNQNVRKPHEKNHQ